MDIRFDGQTVVVSGARWGIGHGIARHFLESGARVFCCDKESAGLEELERLGAQVVTLDLTDTCATNAWVSGIETQTGGPVQILINNAGGFGLSAPGEFLDATDEAWESAISINLMTAVKLSRAIVPGMQSAGYGRIINISSGAGIAASGTINHPYTSAKHAVVGFTRQLAFGLGQCGITVNTIAPGFVLAAVDTLNLWDSLSEGQKAAFIENVYMRRPGQIDDIAPAALFLASDYASWITGQVISINGGRAV